ncbi:hypothetical protein EVAR_13384_1 [Eumeta japonica]|uniref:Gustatory receptor n=1 Tax=Eumeta variegata TaxID=151549 RepID=A0A4C1TRZ1_EUMVA|nr:hypothetical protein EVAR_13384_1 [Eumeta japonica]
MRDLYDVKNTRRRRSVIANLPSRRSYSEFGEHVRQAKCSYETTVGAMKFLNAAIKWPYNAVTVIGLLMIDMLDTFTLFVPCLISERIFKEVENLKTQLQFMPLQMELGEKDRRLIRSFTKLIEECDLSVTPFNVFELGLHLPLRFLGMILAYVIVLLQFDRVLEYRFDVNNINYVRNVV